MSKRYLFALFTMLAACAVDVPPQEPASTDPVQPPTTTERRYCKCSCYSYDLFIGFVQFDYDNSSCSTGNGQECTTTYNGATAYGKAKSCGPIIDNTTSVELEEASYETTDEPTYD